MSRQPKYPLARPNDVAAAQSVPDPLASVPGPQVPMPKVKLNTKATRHVMTRGQHNPGCWVQAGTLECFAATDWALTELARERGVKTNPNTGEVEKLRAARVGEETAIYFYPTESTDPDGVEIKRTKGQRGSRITANFYDFLAMEKLLIATGKRERFDLVKVSDSESPVGPALKLDLARPLESQPVSTRKKGATNKQQSRSKQPETKPAAGAESTEP